MKEELKSFTSLFKSKSFISFLAVFVATFIVINEVSSDIVYSADLIPNDYSEVQKELQRLNRETQQPKLVIFGSSMAREAIDQYYLKEQLGDFSIFKFAVSGGAPTDFYFLWSAARGREDIDIAVIPLSPWMFQKKNSHEIEQREGTGFFATPLSMARLYGPNASQATRFVKQGLTSPWDFYKFEAYLLDFVDRHNISFWKAQEQRATAAWKPFQYSINKPDAYFTKELKKGGNYSDYDSSNYDWNTQENVQLRAFTLLIAELQKNNTLVILVDMPVHPLKKEFYDEELERDYTAALSHIVGAETLVYDYSATYEKENFIDFNHLNASGRDLFTKELSELIKKASYAL